MKFGVFIVAAGSLVLVLLGVHFCIGSYFNTRQLQSELEVLTMRNRTARLQMGELEQKLRVMGRAKHFMDRAAAADLTYDRWSSYAVDVEEAMSYAALERVVEQCDHSADVYFKPIAFHVAVGGKDTGFSSGDAVDGADTRASGGSRDAGGDVILGLKGVFLVRRR